MWSVLGILVLISILMMGFRSTARSLPGLIILALIIIVFAWFFKEFWPLLLLLFVIRKLFQPAKQKRSYYSYKTYSQEDFEDFFRKAAGAGYQGSQGGYQHRGRSYASPFEDLSKYYQVLGVEKGATKEEVKKAYLKKVKEHHPDRFANASESEKEYHEEMLKKINEAYDTIEKNRTV